MSVRLERLVTPGYTLVPDDELRELRGAAKCLAHLCDELWEHRYHRGSGPLPCCYDHRDALSTPLVALPKNRVDGTAADVHAVGGTPAGTRRASTAPGPAGGRTHNNNNDDDEGEMT